MMSLFATNARNLLVLLVKFERFARFFLVGGTSTLVHNGLLIILTEYGGVASILWWNATATAIATILNFCLQRIWVFKRRDPKTLRRQITRFILKYLALFALWEAGLFVFVTLLGFWYLPVQASLLAVSIPISYWLSNKWVFKL